MQKKEVRHMIYTVTFNPCLDYIVGVEDFQLGMTNRTCSEQMFAGGKGINVSIVLKNLGIESTALGFIAGFTGEEIRRKVEKMGITSNLSSLRMDFPGSTSNSNPSMERRSTAQDLRSEVKNLKDCLRNWIH